MFKVGDEVKVLKEGSHGQDIGTICKIIKIDNKDTNMPYLAKCPNNAAQWFYEKELGKIQFTKSDLKDGDIVTYRNGEKRIVENINLIDETGEIAHRLDYYTNELKVDSRCCSNLDIIKVERPVQYKTVYERKEEILDEAEKRYLRDVIRPFRKDLDFIIKAENYNERQHLEIIFKDADIMIFKQFEKDSMYKNMKIGKKYTLSELRNIKE